MTVYVEYVLLENFVLDCALLSLSLHAAKAPKRRKNLLFSSLFGALFALLFPLLSLPFFCGVLLKFFAGFCLCFIAYPYLKTKKQRSMYALICFFFFCFSCSFAGALFAFLSVFSQNTRGYAVEKIPFALVFSAVVFLCLFSKNALRKFYEKKRVFNFIYPCAIPYGKRVVDVLGFFDSGNKASKNNVPICFVSPLAAYEIWQEDFLPTRQEIEKCTGQVCDQITVQTVSGEKTLSLRLGELQVQQNGAWIKKQVYFAVSSHILSQAYDLLLPASIFDDIT